MPIYMDRHDVAESITAEIVAQIHQEDLRIQDQFGCRGLTYWFDEKRKTAFCLIEAPDGETIKKMHNKAHGQVPHHVIEVESSIVESFLGRIEDPGKAKDTTLNIINDPAFRTIMVIRLQQLSPEYNGDDQTKFSLQRFTDQISPILNVYGEKPVKQTRDYTLVSFRSLSDAVHAALDIRSKFKKFRNEIRNNEIFMKIGLSAGVPVTEKKSIFEDTIRLAEWMCEIIDAEILVSSEVKSLYESENSNRFIKGDNIFALTRQDEKFLTLLMDFMKENWTNPDLRVNDFTRPVGCSKSQLYRKLVALTGKSPNTFVNDYRLEAALKLLNKNEGNVSEIAFETGFTSPSYFSKCFQKKYGRQPSDYLNAANN
jgi:AraC-like DNA-binding protein